MRARRGGEAHHEPPTAASTLKKLVAAQREAGVVVTTPTAIKALLLRYIENIKLLEAPVDPEKMDNETPYVLTSGPDRSAAALGGRRGGRRAGRRRAGACRSSA